MLWLVLQIKETALKMELVTESVLSSDFYKIVKTLHEWLIFGKNSSSRKQQLILAFWLWWTIYGAYGPDCKMLVWNYLKYYTQLHGTESRRLNILLCFLSSKKATLEQIVNYNGTYFISEDRILLCCKIYHYTCHTDSLPFCTVQITAWMVSELATSVLSA